jgi:hypothetical protein
MHTKVRGSIATATSMIHRGGHSLGALVILRGSIRMTLP